MEPLRRDPDRCESEFWEGESWEREECWEGECCDECESTGSLCTERGCWGDRLVGEDISSGAFCARVGSQAMGSDGSISKAIDSSTLASPRISSAGDEVGAGGSLL
ncbi:unnamed protein product [Cylicostephanus goldi]|uniref:Uncharacterized protein n=1 Tax=Cylicostephanus goldi TaxID=71465 RepID=A0A3P6RZE1_CYLGO|nr:unnamed protein product [Cylicostephanus goldi]